ncbi:hypothetical protein Sme01_72530 [Sphaerisporangium melleum]|uniref:Uncharacterized protein n=1 Tax=Sphaerisporangium melleum TaxID=321316 RepID=A0A917RQP5_9ACTN|nr:hypothetical protein [Sphaerisporangium melleum]GGL18182.1 hypothetical protein GCM10007964_70230 [Sphaerisporangium melleum]GII74777.1 hypothetical protein Sme01_72530 [Sphaerisporangium melleum]
MRAWRRTRTRSTTDTLPYPYISECRAKGREEGLAEGETKSVLLVLEGRGLAITEEQRERITSCTDTGRLEKWLRLAGVVATVDELPT